TVGSCSHRLAYCQSAEDELKAIHDAMASSVYCRIAMSASRCFEFVRNDPICYRENMIVDGFEISLVTNIVPTCGAVTGRCVERLKICDSFEYIIKSITTTTGIIIYCGLTERAIDCFERTRISGRCSEPKTSFENRIISLWQANPIRSDPIQFDLIRFYPINDDPIKSGPIRLDQIGMDLI
uniref:Uncharacterized protein n=1 Tax=Biomphalaria glabrata TaxID=6526 RepID=A0A2C9LWP4_BIOGL